MVAAGTGIAPFRGFIQERAAQASAGRKLAPAIFVFGSRRPKEFDSYNDELAQWEKSGAVSVRYAYSRESDASEGCEYVQDRIWKDKQEVADIFRNHGKIFVCGSPSVSNAVKDVCKKIYADIREQNGEKKTDEEMQEWFDGLDKERFATDVFA